MRAEVLGSRLDMRALVVSGLVALFAFAWVVSAAAQSSPAAPAPAPSASATPTPIASPADVENLRERAAAFWAARVAGDFTAQWELLEPRGRARMTAAEYAAGRGAVKYLAYQVEDANANGYFANVKVRLLVQPILPGARRPVNPGAVMVEDNWVRIRGVWYHALEQK